MALSVDMLQAFLKVAETRSVSRAGDALGISKGVVSKRVAQLEHAVQATLFARTTRKVALTPAGEAYVDFARRAMAEMTAGEERVRSLRTELTGRIRVTAPVSWGQRVLAKRVPQFLHEHPAIEIDLQLADRMMDLACEGIDIALRWSAAPPHEFNATQLAPVGWAMAAAPRYLARQGTPHTPQELLEHACLCYWRESSDEAWTLDDGARRVDVRVSGRYHVDNPESVADAALAGLGIALLPDYLCADAIERGDLVRVLPGWTPRTRFGSHITALASPERLRIPRNRVFLAFLREQFASSGAVAASVEVGGSTA